ncbi:MAG: hypothetical protein R2747_18065 [Pyrinomonadaceae bacterium]
MKTKKLLGLGIILTITSSAIAFSGEMPFFYRPLSQLLFDSGKEVNKPILDKISEVSPPEHIVPPVNFENRGPVQNSGEEKREVPDHVVYFILFHHLVGLKKEAEKVAATGQTLDYFGMYEEQAALDNTQSRFLFDTAQNCIDAVKLIDNKARDIIVKEREKFKQIKSQDDPIPQPPAELKELQREKNETVLRYRDEFKSFLGADKFSEFNDFARQKITPQVKDLEKQEGK